MWHLRSGRQLDDPCRRVLFIPFMGVGMTIERTLREYRSWRLRRAGGAIGDFYRAGGNALLSENLPVVSSDLVVDAGGYRGDWTAEMSWRYGCRAIVLEPIPDFVADIRRRFERNDRILIIGAGLGPRDETVEMSLAADGTSSIRAAPHARRIEVPILGVRRLFEDHHLDEVACLKLNIEGAEYDLLDAMSVASLLERVRCLVVQFHDIGQSTQERLRRVRKALEGTHQLRFRHELVWERWDRASPPNERPGHDTSLGSS
jgi:FkbM family methyltransferase